MSQETKNSLGKSDVLLIALAIALGFTLACSICMWPTFAFVGVPIQELAKNSLGIFIVACIVCYLFAIPIAFATPAKKER